MKPFQRIPKGFYPPLPKNHIIPDDVYLNDEFMVQVFNEEHQYQDGMVGTTRLSINRVNKLPDGNWEDKITWDELMEIKRLIGMGKHCAIEIYPPDEHIVNVSNMRHLFIVEAPPFMWRKK